MEMRIFVHAIVASLTRCKAADDVFEQVFDILEHPAPSWMI